jgi:hypothetical protein
MLDKTHNMFEIVKANSLDKEAQFRALLALPASVVRPYPLADETGYTYHRRLHDGRSSLLFDAHQPLQLLRGGHV